MATLREIRKRIHTAQNIKQITKAMEMVAAARLRRAQMKAEQARPYTAKIKQLLQNLAASLIDFKHPFLEQRDAKKIGVVIVAADRGLWDCVMAGQLRSHLTGRRRTLRGRQQPYDAQPVAQM